MADELPIELDRGGDVPLAVQLADALRAAAGSGALRVGDRLSSTRALATQLGVSRTVTAAAYDQLLAEGWLVGRAGAGTFVTAAPGTVVTTTSSPTTSGLTTSGLTTSGLTTSGLTTSGLTTSGPAPRVAPSGPAPRAAPARPERTGPGGRAAGDPPPGALDLTPGHPCLAALDDAAWRRAWRAAAEAPPDGGPCYPGLPVFRSAVVEHLLRHRGLAVEPGRVLATAGSTSAVAELAEALPPGSRVALEEPGYQRAGSALAARGLEVVPAEVDADGGLRVDQLPRGLAAVYCTPAHQYPLGARLSAASRVALVRRARAEGFLVIEDDYDGELRYDVAPLPLLAALDPDVVAHLGTASKLLTPTLGVGWMVAPAAVTAAVLAARERTGARPAPAGQQVFAALAGHGDLARHLRRLRRELTARRALVVDGLTAHGVRSRGDAAGAHVLLTLPSAEAERRLLERAEAEGLGLVGLRACHRGPAAVFGAPVGYALTTRPELARAVAVLGRLVRELG